MKKFTVPILTVGALLLAAEAHAGVVQKLGPPVQLAPLAVPDTGSTLLLLIAAFAALAALRYKLAPK